METKYPYEKLGLMYLGRELDLDSGAPSNIPFLYKNKNLTTHAAIIGMTGSGKTGLGIGVIEEAIMDNIPSIIIDPKGDMGNLLLSFPNCAAKDFFPWVDPAEAAKNEMSPQKFADKTAGIWREGLQSWGQGPDRIGVMREKTEMTIYTPGSSAGVPVSVLGSFDPPTKAVLGDTDTLNSLINGTVTSLLALVDITGDPLQSKEHILLSSLLIYYWRKGESLTMESLIGAIVSPPFDKVGVFSLDTFYPQPQRMALAMSLNNILASPTFSSWVQGEPLDIQRILYGEDGKPRTAIFSIAHLSETERMFFVTMLLNSFIGWMRRQQGSGSLKALLYMDEIFGFFPPTANPPSKKPMLLLLKQARAFGVGVVLATQNPVDLDYKGLSNIGTWFVGRLQTRQDQERVVEGIVGASDGQLDIPKVRSLLNEMKGRQFLLNSAHLDGPVFFETRWVMSYLKGPISTQDIKLLMAPQKTPVEVETVVSEEEKLPAPPTGGAEGSPVAPVVSSDIEQLYYLQNLVSDEIVLTPWLGAEASVRFYNSKRNIDIVETFEVNICLDEYFQRLDWSQAEDARYNLDDCGTDPPDNSRFLSLADGVSGLKNFRGYERELADHLYQTKRLELYRVEGAGFESEPGESLVDFKIRFGDYQREQKESAIEKLRDKYRVKQDRLEQKLNRAIDKLDKEKQDVKSKTTDSIIHFGAAIVGAFFGRKTLSAGNVSKAATGMRSIGRVAKEKSDVKRAEQDVVEAQQAVEDLAVEIEDRIEMLGDNFRVDNVDIETFAIKPRRSDIFDLRISLVWEQLC